MAKSSKSLISGESKPTDAPRVESRENAVISRSEGKEHRALYPKAWAGVKLLVDNQEYTLDQLLDVLWEAQEHRDLLAKEIDDSMTATIRIYGQPPYDDCSLSEYLEIVADGQLDDVRKEFEELFGGDDDEI